MGMARSTYYFEINKVDVVESRNEELLNEIKDIFKEHKGRYGVRRCLLYTSSVDRCHLNGLLILDDNIVQKLLIFRILFQPFVSGQTVKHHPIRPEGRGKINQSGLQFVQCHQIHIFRIALDTFFNLYPTFIQNPQIGLV